LRKQAVSLVSERVEEEVPRERDWAVSEVQQQSTMEVEGPEEREEPVVVKAEKVEVRRPAGTPSCS
jgi:hypothetical protein